MIRKRVIAQNQRDVINRLKQIILTQSRLAEADFDLNLFMNLAVHQIQRLTPATGAVIELVEGKDMVYRAATGSIKKFIGLRLQIKNSISGLCVSSNKVLICKETEHDRRVNLAACRRVKARSLIVAPLYNQGEIVGVLKIISKRSHAFTQVDVQILKMMAGLIGSALAKQIFADVNKKLLVEKTKALRKLKRAEKKLIQMAHYDFLTGLPNRILFSDRLSQILLRVKRNKQKGALMFLDVDHFKSINDTLGHAYGDELLKLFSDRLKQCLRASDTVARLGGDEFVIIIDEVKQKSDINTISNKILNKMRIPFMIKKREVKVTTSIGIAFLDETITNATALLKNADQALYAAKEAGRNVFRVYQDN